MTLPVYALSEDGNERILVGEATVTNVGLSVELNDDKPLTTKIREGMIGGVSVEPRVCVDIINVKEIEGD